MKLRFLALLAVSVTSVLAFGAQAFACGGAADGSSAGSTALARSASFGLGSKLKVFTATSRADKLNGTNSNDRIDLGSGNDAVNSHFGNDTVLGGAGNDLIDTCGDSDKANGGAGGDLIVAGDGNDQIEGGSGKDVVYAQQGRDRIEGDGGADKLWALDRSDVTQDGDRAGDRVSGGAGSDSIYTRDGEVDKISCGPDRDRVIADPVDRILDGSCEEVKREDPVAGQDDAEAGKELAICTCGSVEMIDDSALAATLVK